MKTKTIMTGIVLMLIAMPLIQAKTLEETQNQKLISHIQYNPTRLKNFCSGITTGYPSTFLANKWFEYCLKSSGSIRAYDYKNVFDNMRVYMKEHKLRLLTQSSVPETKLYTEEKAILSPCDSCDGHKPLTDEHKNKKMIRGDN